VIRQTLDEANNVSMELGEDAVLRIVARDVPPFTVADALKRFRLGRLRDYDQAELSADRLAGMGFSERQTAETPGQLIRVLVQY
jgi:hypothetical protein